MGVYVPNIKKPKHCTECYFVCRDQCELQDNSYDYDTFKEQKKHCPLQKIDLVRCGECEHWNDEDHWCNIRDSYGWDYKPTDFCSYGERRADCEDETDEEWYDWRDEQEYEDRWERRADEHNTERD